MKDPTLSQEELTLPTHMVWPLADHLGLARNELVRLYGYPESDPGEEMVKWWNDLTSEAQARYQPMLQTLAAPGLVANVTLVDEQTIFTARAVLPDSGNSESPYLVAEIAGNPPEIAARPVQDEHSLVETLWEAVLDDSPPGHMESGMVMDRPAFLLLMAIADLDRRRKLAGLLHHTAFRSEMLPEDIHAACREAGEQADPRWLLPFFTALLGEPADWYEGTSAAAIETLIEKELLQKSDRGVLRLSPSGRFFIDSCNHPRALGLQVWGADPDGRVAMQVCSFLRGEKFLWLVETGPPGDSVTVAGLDPSVAPDLLAEVLTPVGAAAAFAPAPAGTSSETVKRGGYCPQCGQAVGPAASFCRACGARIEN